MPSTKRIIAAARKSLAYHMSMFLLPDLGEGLQEAEIVAWHVSAGDHVVADQPLVSVETDKAVVEVPSPRAGHIEALLGEPGDIVAVGAPLVGVPKRRRRYEDRGTVVGEIAAEAVPPQADTVPCKSPRCAPAPRSASTRPTNRVRRPGETVEVDRPSRRGHRMGPTSTAPPTSKQPGPAPTSRCAARAGRWLRGWPTCRAHAGSRRRRSSDDADIDAWPPDADVTLRLISGGRRRMPGRAGAQRLVR